jgi:hypothetical protein
VQRLADRVSAVFVPIVIVLALGTLGYSLAAGEPASIAVTAAVAVLIIAQLCALLLGPYLAGVEPPASALSDRSPRRGII